MPRGTTHFGESEYDREGDAGVATARFQAEQRIQQQHAQIAAAHLAFEEAERARKTAESVALAKEATDRHKRLALALPLLIGINPKDDDARKQYLKFYAEHAGDLEADKAALGHFVRKGAQMDAYEKEQESVKRKQADLEASKKAKEDALKKEQDAAQKERDNPPTGADARQMALRGFTSKTGNRFESTDPSPRKTAAEIEKLESAFRKSHDAYTGSLGVDIGKDVAKNIARGVARNAVVSSGRQLQEALKDNPTEAARVKADMDTALLLEHGRLEPKFSGPAKDAREYEADNPGVLDQFNQVKSALGYQPIKWDEASKKYVPVTTDAAPSHGATPAPNSVGGQKSNSQFEIDAAKAGNTPVKPSFEGAAGGAGDVAAEEQPVGVLADPVQKTPGLGTNPTPAAVPVVNPSNAEALPPPVGAVTAGPTTVVPPGATPHPMEGQTVRHKTSGQTGKIINGQFVPD